ncbi:MAG: glycosyltransferase, partial [Solirubrobacterales bacterium]|nr:glycosyltransferase [Solirubrobacterales bacterium]
RLDYFRALHPRLDPYATRGITVDPDGPEDPQLRSYLSGFWGIVRIGPAPPGARLELKLEARLHGGRTETVGLGSLGVAEPTRRLPLAFPGPAGQPRVAICLATYEPPLDLLRRQLDSIRSQSHANWVCVISDDCSDPGAFETIRGLVADDPRFAVSRSPRRLGFYANFERALALAPSDCDYLALADQDDAWYPDKLTRLLEAIGPAQLVYSDARIIAPDGEVIAPSYWERRRNNHTDLVSLLVANSVTGAASLFRRGLLEYALPFPPGQFAHYHDHWLGLTALALGGIEYVDRPLYDYVQHRSASLGHAAATRITPLRERLGRVRDDPRERVRVNRMRYFVDVMRLEAVASVLELRCGPRMSPPRRGALRRFLALERSPGALAWFGTRAATELARPRPETLGAEWELLQALLWRRALAASARRRPQRRLRLDALPPAHLAPRAGRPLPGLREVRDIAEKIAPLDLAVADGAPRRVNILIPTIDLAHLFGGYIAKLNLARRLAERGLAVRLVTVDPVAPLPRDWRAQVQSYSGLSGLFDRIEVAFGRAGPLEVSRSDAFLASTWWTAHIAQAAVRALGRPGFAYLIQEYEPFTFPMGTYAALAQESYGFEHLAAFSTELLRGYFRAHGIGVYSRGSTQGDRASLAFQNAITRIEPPNQAALAGRRPRRLLLYARPEAHAARNMFELALLALEHALHEGAFRDGWELRGIGSVGPGSRVRLGGGGELQVLPRRDQSDYARLITEHDAGLALMYTPHPSLVPIEMARAGLLTVTNTFENKTADALRAISSNLIPAEPTLESVAGALVEAAAGAEDAERRLSGTAVNWSQDWDTSFDAAFLDRLESYLFSD